MEGARGMHAMTPGSLPLSSSQPLPLARPDTKEQGNPLTPGHTPYVSPWCGRAGWEGWRVNLRRQQRITTWAQMLSVGQTWKLSFSVWHLYNHIPNLFTHKLLIVSLWASMISPRLLTAGSTLVKNLPLEDSTGYSKEFKLLISHDPAHTEQPHLYLRYFFPLLLWTYQD